MQPAIPFRLKHFNYDDNIFLFSRQVINLILIALNLEIEKINDNKTKILNLTDHRTLPVEQNVE